jgi:hypothetical protein
MNQVTLGIAVDVLDSVLAFTLNNGLSIVVPDGLTPVIGKQLVAEGVTVRNTKTQSKIVFPKKGSFHAILRADTEMGQFTVRPISTDELARLFGMASKDGKVQDATEKLQLLINKLPPGGETEKLFDILYSDGFENFAKRTVSEFIGFFERLNYLQLLEEISPAVNTQLADVPAPEEDAA